MCLEISANQGRARTSRPNDDIPGHVGAQERTSDCVTSGGRMVAASDCWGAVAPAPGSQPTREVHIDKYQNDSRCPVRTRLR
jgi:hypothetical protein